VGIGAKEAGNLIRFVNDGATLNLKGFFAYYGKQKRDAVLYRAIQDISPGDELIVSYGEQCWRNKTKKP